MLVGDSCMNNMAKAMSKHGQSCLRLKLFQIIDPSVGPSGCLTPPLRESMKHNNKGLWACMTIPLTSTPSTIINSPQHIDLSVGPPSCLMAPHPPESRLHSLKSTKRWPFVSKLNKIYELDRYWSLTLSIVWIIYLKISSLMDWKTNLYFNQEMFFTLYTHDHIFLYIQKQCHRSSYDECM